MREWQLMAGDLMAPRISADARSGRTTYDDDQTWQLRLGAPDEPALSLETRYGGRLGLARLVPVWTVGRRQVYETQGYHSPPVLVAFAPDYLRLRAGLTLALELTVEFWTMESQAVGGCFTLRNTSDAAQTVTVGLSVQAMRESQEIQKYFLTLENGQVALQLGRQHGLQPVLMLDGAAQTSTTARLTRDLTLAPGETSETRWVLGSMPDRDLSLQLAHKWLSDPSWAAQISAIDERAASVPQIETGDAEWDTALAWSQQLVLRSFLGATGQLPHPSFVTARKTATGYAVAGQHAGGFAALWGGQTVPDAWYLAGNVALGAPDLARGMVRNFLAAQREDGWIDARPGLGGQRANVMAPPLLASLAATVYRYTRDEAFLAEVFEGLLAFYYRWFRSDMDHNGDGLPEWSTAGQGAFADSPVLAQHQRWAQGIDVATIQSPDLAAYLIREGRALSQLAEIVGRADVAQELAPRLAALQTHLDALWNAELGRFHYQDRDTGTCPAGEIIYEGKGDSALSETTDLPQASRLIVRVRGGLSRKPKMDCTIEGIDGQGNPANETLAGDAFEWYRGTGSATTRRVWRTIKYLRFSGLSRVFSIEVATTDLTRPDVSLYTPLLAGTLDEARAARLIADLTDPDQYWRPYGIAACPANEPAYDPAQRGGCGAIWPEWNARLGLALLENDRAAESAEAFTRLLRAQIASLKAEGTFRRLYDAETGEGLGDADVIQGVVSLDWFARLFGAFAVDPGTVVVTGLLAFAERTLRWTQYGVLIQRTASETLIEFPGGHQVRLAGDAEPQIVRDPGYKPPQRVAPAPLAAPAPEPPPVVRPDEGLLPDGT